MNGLLTWATIFLLFMSSLLNGVGGIWGRSFLFLGAVLIVLIIIKDYREDKANKDEFE